MLLTAVLLRAPVLTKKLEKPHIAYACVGIFSTIFSLVSLFVKEKLFIGEATVATIAGLILGPHCLGWFDPISWGNTDLITLEICRIVLCIQIVAVAVELPRKYMKKHWLSVFIFLLPVMTCGWLVVGLFIWALIPHFDFPSALLVSACVTATDPVLAAAVVGKGKFAERVPGHLRNLLTAESGCNDGMAFPFIFLSLNLVLHPGKPGTIIKDWILLTILWECIFGCILGVVLGFVLKRAVAFAEKKNLIDRESFLAIFVFLAFNSAGIGSMLGVDDLLVSFAAGTAFGWNGDFAKKTEESHVSTVIDLLLNLAFFVYFGAIVPWAQFNNADLGLNAWRLVVLAVVIIFLRRLPAVIALKPFTPDVKSWREAFFCGHFGPIGVGAIFAVILARKDLEAHYTTEETPLYHLPNNDFPHYQLLAAMWPIVCFVVIVSIVVHGSSVAVLTLGRQLNRMAITMSLTATNTQDQGPSWMSRLQKLDRRSSSFSLHRIDTQGVPTDDIGNQLPKSNTVETSGIKVRPAGGAKRRKHKKRRKEGAGSRLKKTFLANREGEELGDKPITERQRPQTEFLQLGKTPSRATAREDDGLESPKTESPATAIGTQLGKEPESGDSDSSTESIRLNAEEKGQHMEIDIHNDKNIREATSGRRKSMPTIAYQEGKHIIIEDQDGEIIETIPFKKRAVQDTSNGENDEDMSIHSEESLRRHMSHMSSISSGSENSDSPDKQTVERRIFKTMTSGKRRGYYSKKDPQRKVYAHQVDNLIVIENFEGEIIRRYRVNRHRSNTTRTRTGSIVGRALSLVGIKGKDKEPRTTTGEAVPSISVSHVSDDKRKILAPDINEDDNESTRHTKLENKITEMLTQGPRKTTPVVPEEPEEEDSEISNDSEELDESDDELQETEVEKKRRLAALGHLTARRDLDDEEE